MFHIREKDSGFLYFEDLELHTIELKKFTPNSNDEISDLIDKVKKHKRFIEEVGLSCA